MTRAGGRRPFGARVAALALLAAASAVAAGCSETVLRTGREAEASRAAGALERHGVPARLEATQRGRESSYELRVEGADAPQARAILAAYGLPRAPRAGAATLAAAGGLVASPAEERARLAAAVSLDVEQSLESIDGVLEARVHVAFPLGEDPAFAPDAEVRPPRASVLVRHRADAAAPAAADVRRLVVGAVDGLAPEAVEVVLLAVAVPRPAADGWQPLGPFEVRAGSHGPLLALIVGGLIAIAALAALLVWSRLALRRARRHAP
ncbi:MAG: secretion protein [Deltaproteobacteria bacterium]|nr:secretion protein [Deltaproteobacteria bacterium]